MPKEERSITEHTKLASIKGAAVPYDLCAPEFTDRPRYDYIGRGPIHSVNGVRQSGDVLYYFYTLKKGREIE